MSWIFQKIFKYPDNIYGSVKPLYYFSQIFGLACYRSKSTNGQHRYEMRIVTVLRYFVQILMFCALFIYDALTEDSDFYGNQLMVMLQYFQDTIVNVLSIINLVFCVIFANKIVEMFSIIDNVDKKLKSLHIFIDNR